MDILVYPLAVANSGSGKRMHRESQVSNSGFAHLLLMCDGGDGEFTRLLLEQRKRGDFGLLCI
jgi:hypothetical protein